MSCAEVSRVMMTQLFVNCPNQSRCKFCAQHKILRYTKAHIQLHWRETPDYTTSWEPLGGPHRKLSAKTRDRGSEKKPLGDLPRHEFSPHTVQTHLRTTRPHNIMGATRWPPPKLSANTRGRGSEKKPLGDLPRHQR